MSFKKILLTLSVMGGLFIGSAALVSAAGCVPFLPAQGGTGNCGLGTGFINFGNTSATSPFATSSNLFWTNAAKRLNFTYASSTAQSTGAFAVTGSGTSTVISNTIQAACFSTNGITCLSSGGGSGTVTSVASSNGIIGGTITAAGTLSLQSYIATSSGETAGQLAVYTSTNGTPALLGKVATTTLSGSGLISVTAGAVVIGGSPITVSCASCSSTVGTVTSVASSNGIQGGTITAAGTLSLISYLATSTSETSGDIPFWTTTSGTPAQLSGGVAAFAFSSAASRLTVTNASTTAFSTAYASSTNFFIGTSVGGIASTSVNTPTGNIFLVHSVPIVVASSSLLYFGAYGTAGTTTTAIANPLHSSTLTTFFCKTDVGTAYVEFGTGSATTTGKCTVGGTLTTPASNNTWTGRQTIYMGVGTEATNPNIITVTADVEDQN